jgi:uncharacterized protein YfaT (DUF1175 family)
MKKLLFIVFPLFLGLNVHAQNVSLPDLINLASLTNDQAQGYLTEGKPFKQAYTQNVDGLNIEQFQLGNSVANKETVTVGNGIKTNSGVFLHTVIYTTPQTKYLLSLIAQAKKSDLDMYFQGADATKSIYLFDNVLYTVNIYINIDNTAGSVEVKQKEYMNYEQ